MLCRLILQRQVAAASIALKQLVPHNSVPLNLARVTNRSLQEDNFLFVSSQFYLYATAGKSPLTFVLSACTL